MANQVSRRLAACVCQVGCALNTASCELTTPWSSENEAAKQVVGMLDSLMRVELLVDDEARALEHASSTLQQSELLSGYIRKEDTLIETLQYWCTPSGHVLVV